MEKIETQFSVYKIDANLFTSVKGINYCDLIASCYLLFLIKNFIYYPGFLIAISDDPLFIILFFTTMYFQISKPKTIAYNSSDNGLHLSSDISSTNSVLLI